MTLFIRDFCAQLLHGARMAKPPSSSSGPRGPRPPAKRAPAPPRIRWDNKPARRSKPASDAPSKGALERDDGDARIAKLLARAGVASRREVERMIEDRRITLNGEVVETPATLLKNLDGVAVDGVAVGKPAPTMLYMFHKPEGCLTAERDFSGRKTIYDLLPPELPRVMPIGRLDLNTEGLLLLTNDGEFKRQMELPSTGVERTYRARCFGDVTQTQLEDLIQGVEVDGVLYGKIDANMERRTGANVWIEMTLTEGKNREVRRVLEHLGLEVNRLIRTRYGPFVLGNIAPGVVAEVRKVDLIEFRASLKQKVKP
jgi:23S rRNA pseudouridine2605 synthase